MNVLTRSTRTPARPEVFGATKAAHGNAEAENRNVSGVIVEAPARPQLETDCQIDRPYNWGAQ